MNTYFSGKTVVVTGAAGFVGSHLCDWLLAAGARVVGIDNFITGRASNVDAIRQQAGDKVEAFTFIEADVSQPVANYFPTDITPDVVLHFASPASPPQYQAQPVETYLVNSMGTHYWLDFLRQHFPTARFLFASTSEVYGDPAEHPQSESYWGNVNPNGIRSCYDEAKRLGETICGVFFRDFGIDTRMVRIFNTYGPRINPGDGRVVPQFVGQALRGESLTVYGDGSQTRSFCYVSDLVAGIVALAAHEDGAGQTVNLGNPVEQTVTEIAEQVRQAVAAKTGEPLVSIEYRPLPGDDPTRRQPDISKAAQLLQWKPQVSFADGLALTIEHFIVAE